MVSILTSYTTTEDWMCENLQSSQFKKKVIFQILTQILVLNQNKICPAVLIFSIKFNMVFWLLTPAVKHFLHTEVEEKSPFETEIKNNTSYY